MHACGETPRLHMWRLARIPYRAKLKLLMRDAVISCHAIATQRSNVFGDSPVHAAQVGAPYVARSGNTPSRPHIYDTFMTRRPHIYERMATRPT